MTSATLLANRDTIIVPGTSITIDEGLLLGLFDLTWTGFTVLWFAQIFPKDLAATNPDRYLHPLRRLFPVVEVVRKIGVSQPGEWVAALVERRLNWPLTPAEEIQEGSCHARSRWGASGASSFPAEPLRLAPRTLPEHLGPDSRLRRRPGYARSPTESVVGGSPMRWSSAERRPGVSLRS
jgi:hypothetical protein